MTSEMECPVEFVKKIVAFDVCDTLKTASTVNNDSNCWHSEQRKLAFTRSIKYWVGEPDEICNEIEHSATVAVAAVAADTESLLVMCCPQIKCGSSHHSSLLCQLIRSRISFEHSQNSMNFSLTFGILLTQMPFEWNECISNDFHKLHWHIEKDFIYSIPICNRDKCATACIQIDRHHFPEEISLTLDELWDGVFANHAFVQC